MAHTSILAQRYASALLDLAIAQNNLPDVRRDMVALHDLWSQSSQLQEAMSNATYAPEQRLAALLALLSSAKPHKLSVNFLNVVAANGRLGYVGDMAVAFGRIADDYEGIKAVDVTVPYALKAPLRKKVEALLHKVIGKEINLSVNIDPSLLDGLQVKVGSTLYDASLKRQLQDLQQGLITLTNRA